MPAFRTAVAAAVACLCLPALAACDRAAETPATAPPAAAPEPAPPRVQLAALTRSELIEAFDAAASAFAEGRAGPLTPRLAGRQFSLVQAFGCSLSSDGPAPGLAGVSPGADGALALALTPADWSDLGLVRQAAPEAEAVEGVWLTRPWLRTAVCPAAPADPRLPSLPSPQTYGLAVIFAPGGSRIARRGGRPYSHIVRGTAGEPARLPPEGYRLVVSGRLATFADGRAIRCAAAGPEQRPTCVAAVEIDEVAFTDAGGAKLSAWRN